MNRKRNGNRKQGQEQEQKQQRQRRRDDRRNQAKDDAWAFSCRAQCSKLTRFGASGLLQPFCVLIYILHVDGFDSIRISSSRVELTQRRQPSGNSTRKMLVCELLVCRMAVMEGTYY